MITSISNEAKPSVCVYNHVAAVYGMQFFYYYDVIMMSFVLSYPYTTTTINLLSFRPADHFSCDYWYRPLS